MSNVADLAISGKILFPGEFAAIPFVLSLTIRRASQLFTARITYNRPSEFGPVIAWVHKWSHIVDRPSRLSNFSS